jgi:dGTPase
MYRHPGVVAMQDEAKAVVRDLFQWYMADPALLPDAWTSKARTGDDGVRARVVGDYIAGMTDNFAHREHARIAAGRVAA